MRWGRDEGICRVYLMQCETLNMLRQVGMRDDGKVGCGAILNA